MLQPISMMHGLVRSYATVIQGQPAKYTPALTPVNRIASLGLTFWRRQFISPATIWGFNGIFIFGCAQKGFVEEKKSRQTVVWLVKIDYSLGGPKQYCTRIWK